MSKKSYSPPTIERNVSGLMNKFGHGVDVQICDRIDGVSVDDLVREHGTPLFVYSEGTLREQIRKARRAFGKRYPRVKFAWSYKTCYLKAVCAVFHEEGSLAEVVSDFEYDKARGMGIPGNQIIVNGPHKPPALLRRAVEEGARIHVDNLDELLELEKIGQERGSLIDIAIRVNMNAGVYPAWTKFGFNLENGEALRTIRRIGMGRRLRLVGLHTHLGTFILEPKIYQTAVHKLLELAAAAKKEFDTDLEYLDLGGGFASRNTLHTQYLPGDQVTPTFDQYAEAICDALNSGLPAGNTRPELILETGRALVDEAGYLITAITAQKRAPDGRCALIADIGVNMLYTSTWYRLRALPTREVPGPISDAILYGPLCMNIDVIREHVQLPPLEMGDTLVLHPVGAYNFVQSMQFITYRPAVVLIGMNGAVDVIRRRETLDYVEAMERLPERLMAKRGSL